MELKLNKSSSFESKEPKLKLIFFSSIFDILFLSSNNVSFVVKIKFWDNNFFIFKIYSSHFSFDSSKINLSISADCNGNKHYIFKIFIKIIIYLFI